MNLDHNPDALLEHIARALRMPPGQWLVGHALEHGLRVDAFRDTLERSFIIEVKTQAPREDSIAQLALYRHILAKRSDKPITAVLVAPVVPKKMQHIAALADIECLAVPFELLPESEASGVPLTTPASWSIIFQILKDQGSGSIEDLATRAQVSVGWTHKVLRELEARGFTSRTRGRTAIINERGLLDAITTERPIQQTPFVIETGHRDWDALVQLLKAQFSQLSPDGSLWGLAATSAAAWWTGYETRHNRLDVYVEDKSRLERLARGTGGIPIMVYPGDRKFTFSEVRGTPVSDLRMTLLDVLGLGYGHRDLALKVLEKVRA